LFMIPGVLLVTVWILAACGPASTTSGANCSKGICVDIQLAQPIRFNQPVTATITVETERDIPKLSVALASQYSVLVEGARAWEVDAKAHQQFIFTGTVRFTLEGYVGVTAGVKTTLGEYVEDVVPVYVTRAGGTANPTMTSGTPAPQPTLSPFDSPLPTPSPLKSSLLSPSAGQWVLVTGQDFEGAFPPSGWIPQDLSADGYERYWGKTNYRTVSGSGAIWPARGGANGIDPALSATHDYTNNLNSRLIYGPFDLSDAVLAQVQFQLWREIELNYDYLAVEASHDSVTFQTVVTWTGTSTTWAVNSASYKDYLGDNSVWTAWRFYSDASVTRDGPYVDDVYIWKYVPGEVEVRGSFAYADRAGQSQPARYMKVYLYDADPGGTDDLLAETIVGSTGTFVFLPLRNWDVDGGIGQTSTTGRLDLYVVWETDFNDSASARRRVTNFSDGTYRYYSAVQADASDGTADFLNYFVPPNDPQQGAMWIFQDLRRGWEYIQNTTGTDPGSATVRWEKDKTGLSPCNSGCFWPFPSVNGIFLPFQPGQPSDIVVHELGHQYMYNASGWWGVDVSCFNHSIFNRTDWLCAWTEGWSDYFALAVNNGDTCFDFGIGPCGAGGLQFENLETHARGDGQPEGDDVEGRVAGALYDLSDSVDDGYDHANFGFSPIWTIVGDNSDENRFGLFWLTWIAFGYNQHRAVQAIYQNSIDYDTPPSIANIPDRVALQNLPLMGAADLWDYSSDQESTDPELTWAVAGTTGGCGASIRDHFVDVFPPQNWQGVSCNITVQVSDGIKTGSDTFNVHTVPIVARAYLPLILKDSVVQAPISLINPNPFVSPLPVPAQPNPFLSPLPTPQSPWP
jgi:hypothetical protein